MENGMTLRTFKPTPPLAPYIESFGLREARLGVTEKYHPLAARSDCFLEFYLADRYRIVNTATGAHHLSPQAVLVGPQTARREDLMHTGTLKVFNIRFSPIGLRALFAVPPREVAGHAEPAAHVLGPAIHELEDRLATASSNDMPRIAEHFLLHRLLQRTPTHEAFLANRIARSIAQSHGTLPIERLATQHLVGRRQLERLFEHHVGLTPKLFSRLGRFAHALSQPAGDWAAIAATAGYFDQSHLIRDYHAFTGETPANFQALRRYGPRLSHLSNPAPLASR